MTHSVEGRVEALANRSAQQDAKKTGKINGKTVTNAQKHPASKGWTITALVVGILVVIGAGGFGTVGLIHSHGIALPHWLQWIIPALNTVGNTSHAWSLWTMAIGGGVLGGALTLCSAYKIHQIRKEESVKPIEFSMDDFGDHFDELQLAQANYRVCEESYRIVETAEGGNLVIIKRADKLECYNRLVSEEELGQLINLLRSQQYIPSEIVGLFDETFDSPFDQFDCQGLLDDHFSINQVSNQKGEVQGLIYILNRKGTLSHTHLIREEATQQAVFDALIASGYICDDTVSDKKEGSGPSDEDSSSSS